MQEKVNTNKFEEAEKVVDSILKMMGFNPQEVVREAPVMSEISASMHPTWSADGKQIAYASTRSGTTQVWVMNADGSGQKQLTHGLGGRFPDANVPCWSLDGKLITFWAGYEHKYGDVWVMEPDGKNPRRVTHTEPPTNSDDPRWAPDATKIIYGSGSPGKRDMYLIDVASGTSRLFVKGIQWCDWQPMPKGERNSLRSGGPEFIQDTERLRQIASFMPSAFPTLAVGRYLAGTSSRPPESKNFDSPVFVRESVTCCAQVVLNLFRMQSACGRLLDSCQLFPNLRGWSLFGGNKFPPT